MPRGQHRVRRVLGQLGGTDVHEEHPLVAAHERGVDGAQLRDRALVVGADDDAVRPHEVLDRRAFLQELGVARDGEGHLHAALAQRLRDGRADAVRRAHGHRGLVDDHLPLGHAAADVARGLEHVLHVGRPVLVRRRADGDELQRAVRHGLVDVRGEREPARLDVAADHRLEAGLVDGDPALLQDVDLARIHVEAQDVVAHFREAGAGDQADVARADHRDLHERDAFVSWSRMLASAAAGSGAAVIGRPITSQSAPSRTARLRRRDARLVLGCAARGPDARRDQRKARAAGGAQGARFARRADHAVEAAGLRQAREAQHLRFRRVRDADRGEVGGPEAREDGDADQKRRAAAVAAAASRPPCARPTSWPCPRSRGRSPSTRPGGWPPRTLARRCSECRGT